MFQLLRKHIEMCGIEISQESPRNHSVNVKNSIIFVLVCMFVVLSGLPLIEVDSFHERTDILFTAACLGICGALYATIIFKTPKLFEFIKNLEDIVNESE